MSPPPPLLGRNRKKGDHSFDPALDDVELAAVRDKFVQGRWGSARTLLAGTGADWDRRGHRVVALAETPTAVGWARDWLLAEPGSPDAATLLACATVFRALRGKASADKARAACEEAARLAPDDPTPWLGLLLLARAGGTQEETARLFGEVSARHPDHHHAHHLMVAGLAETSRAAQGSPHEAHEVYDFAAAAAERAPADSPLAILPVVAHAERYRVLVADGAEYGDPAASGHWVGRRARQVLKTAFDWWLEWEGEEHPRSRIDLNFLAHAKFCAGRSAEAAALFHRIGGHATPAPWSYPGRDPYRAFIAARDAALGAV